MISRNLTQLCRKLPTITTVNRAFATLPSTPYNLSVVEPSDNYDDYFESRFDNVLKVYLVQNGNPMHNAYILFDRAKCDGALIDPGVNGYKLLKAIEHCQVNISKVFLTNAHKAHSSCIPEIIHNFGSIPVYMNEAEKTVFNTELGEQLRSVEDLDLQFLKDADAIDVAGHTGKAIHTPGYTAGSMCYLFGGFLFTGNSLICNKIGDTSFEDSNRDQLKQSIKEKLFVLRKETLILPGNGPFTSIATEAIHNPEVGSKHSNSVVCYFTLFL